MTGGPIKKCKTIVVERKVTKEEYLAHVEKMQKLGLDPERDAAPAPVYDAPDTNDMHTEQQANGKTTIKVAPRPSWEGLALAKKKCNYRKLGKPFTQAEKMEEKKHVNALQRFATQLEEWENFRKVASKVTKRDVNDLVITRAEEYRELVELRELLEQATPDDIQSGGHSWFHSLRGDGSRFIQVGNIFSGLWVPVKLQKENIDSEIFRKPWLKELSQHRIPHKDGGKRTWRDDEYLLARLRRYRKKMQEIAAGKLDFDELMEPTCVGLQRPKSREVSEKISEGRVNASPFPTIEESVEEYNEGICESINNAALPEEEPVEQRQGPALEFYPPKLEFHCKVEETRTGSIQIKNVGTTVLFYEWNEDRPPQGYENVSVGPEDPTKYFRCYNPKGKLLPQSTAMITFSFHSQIAGAYRMNWAVSTHPNLLEPIDQIQLFGMCSTGDPFVELLVQFDDQWSKTMIHRNCEELMNDIFDEATKNPIPHPDDLTEEQKEQIKFEAVNPMLHWNPDLMKELVGVMEYLNPDIPEHKKPKILSFKERFPIFRGIEPIEPPVIIPPPFVWDLSMAQIWDDVHKKPENTTDLLRIRRDVRIIERKAKKKWAENSPNFSFCEKLLSDACAEIPALLSTVREELELPPEPQQPTEEEPEIPEDVLEKEGQVRDKWLASIENCLLDSMEVFSSQVINREIQQMHQTPIPNIHWLDHIRQLQTTEDFDVSEQIVFYEPDLDNIEDAEDMKSRLRGLTDIIESAPAVCIIIVHPDYAQTLHPLILEVTQANIPFATPTEISAEVMLMSGEEEEEEVVPKYYLVDLSEHIRPQYGRDPKDDEVKIEELPDEDGEKEEGEEAQEPPADPPEDGEENAEAVEENKPTGPPLIETMLWTEREIWFELNFPYSYDVYVQDNYDGLFKESTAACSVGFSQPARPQRNMIGPHIEGQLNVIYKEILKLEKDPEEMGEDPSPAPAAGGNDSDEDGDENVPTGGTLLTFGGTGDTVLADTLIFKSIINSTDSSILLMEPYSSLVFAEIFHSADKGFFDYFVNLAGERDIYFEGPRENIRIELYDTENPPEAPEPLVSIVYDCTNGHLLKEIIPQKTASEIEEENEADAVLEFDGENSMDKEEEPREDPVAQEEAVEEPPAEEGTPEGEDGEPKEGEEEEPVLPPEPIAVKDLLWNLMKPCGGILCAGNGLTSELIDLIYLRNEKGFEDEEDDDEEEEDEEDEDEDGSEKVPKVIKEKFGIFENLMAIGQSGACVTSTGNIDLWIALSTSTSALRLLSTPIIGALSLDRKLIKVESVAEE